MLTYELMRLAERHDCVELAADAFADYEYFSLYVPEDRRRLRFLRAMLAAEFRANAHRAFFFTVKKDGILIAVAMLCDSEYKKPTDMEYMKAGYGKAFLHGGIRNVSAWNTMEAEALKPCHSLAGGVWYLNLLTVAPAFEGRGIGTMALHEQIIPYVREHGGKALCLFTNSERNRLFYQKNGFTEFHAQQFSYKGKSIGSWSYRIQL